MDGSFYGLGVPTLLLPFGIKEEYPALLLNLHISKLNLLISSYDIHSYQFRLRLLHSVFGKPGRVFSPIGVDIFNV